MQLVIDIPGEIRKAISDGVYCGILDMRVFDAIKNGVALPEDHGDLIDRNDLYDWLSDADVGMITDALGEDMDIYDLPTIIPADEYS